MSFTAEEIKSEMEIINNKLDGLTNMVHKLAALNGERLMSVAEFSELTGLSERSTEMACKKGKLKARQDKPGACWRILGSEAIRVITEAMDNLKETLVVNGRRFNSQQYRKVILHQLSQQQKPEVGHHD